MAKEAVEAVRDAERLAAQTEEAAQKEKDAILLKAQQEAKNLVAAMTKDALAKSEQSLAQAQRQGEAAVEAARQRAENEISELKGVVQGKMQAAIDLVISEIA